MSSSPLCRPCGAGTLGQHPFLCGQEADRIRLLSPAQPQDACCDKGVLMDDKDPFPGHSVEGGNGRSGDLC